MSLIATFKSFINSARCSLVRVCEVDQLHVLMRLCQILSFIALHHDAFQRVGQTYNEHRIATFRFRYLYTIEHTEDPDFDVDSSTFVTIYQSGQSRVTIHVIQPKRRIQICSKPPRRPVRPFISAWAKNDYQQQILLRQNLFDAVNRFDICPIGSAFSHFLFIRHS